MVPDYCSKYEDGDITTKTKIYEKVAIVTQIWHQAKFYFTCISSPWYLIMVKVLNMMKIQPMIMEEWIRTDRLTKLSNRRTDKWTRPVPIILDFTVADLRIIKQ